MNEQEQQTVEISHIIYEVLFKHLKNWILLPGGTELISNLGADLVVELVRAGKIVGVKFDD